MIEHQITASAYVVIGVCFLAFAWWLNRLNNIRLLELTNDCLTDTGREMLLKVKPIAVGFIVLLGAFIFACAVDHFAHGQLSFWRAFESGISAFTAAVVVFVGWKARALWKY